jgi:spore germination protein KC
MTGALPRADAKISHFQLLALLALSALFTQTTGGDFSMSRFVTLTVSAAVMLVIFTPLLLLSRKRSNLLAIPNAPLKWAVGVLLIARLLYAAVAAAISLNAFVTETILEYLTPIFFVIVAFSAILYGSHKGVQATARIAPVALALLLITIASVSLMLIPQLEFVRLYSPLGDAATRNLPRIIGGDILRNDELFYFLALSGFVREKDGKSQSHKAILYYLPVALFVSLWLNVLYTAVLGRFMMLAHYPLYTVAGLSTFNVIERMDGVAATVLIIAALLKITIAFICVRIVLAELIHRDIKSRKPAAKITTSALVAGVAVLTVFLTSCSEYSAFTRTEQRMIVQLVGIDYDDGVYTVSVQCALGTSSGGEMDGEASSSVKSISGSGHNIYAAIKQARSDMGMELFFGHNQVLLLGEGVLANDAVAAIEGYLNHASFYTTPLIAGVNGSAADVLTLSYRHEATPRNRILTILKNARNMGVSPAYTIHESLHFAYSTSGSFFLPILRVEDTGVPDEDTPLSDPIIAPFGGVLIIDGVAAAFLDSEHCAGLSLLANNAQIPGIDFADGDTIHTLEIFKTRTRITPRFESGILTVSVDFSAVTDKSHSCEQNLAELLIPATAAASQRLQNAAVFMSESGGDLFAIEDTLKNRDFALWQELTADRESWREIIRSARFEINVNLSII